jgi:hypothetical protein
LSAERVVYVDSSALVKLAVAEPESAALRTYLRRRGGLVSSALARTEVERALQPLGSPAVRRGLDVLRRVELIRVSDRILAEAGSVQPPELRSLDAIHLATIQRLGSAVTRVVSYDDRLSRAAAASGYPIAAPA